MPSADTSRRVLGRLNPEAFERCFMNWMPAVVELAEGKLPTIGVEPDGVIREQFKDVDHSQHHTVDAGHGRTETRCVLGDR